MLAPGKPQNNLLPAASRGRSRSSTWRRRGCGQRRQARGPLAGGHAPSGFHLPRPCGQPQGQGTAWPVAIQVQPSRRLITEPVSPVKILAIPWTTSAVALAFGTHRDASHLVQRAAVPSDVCLRRLPVRGRRKPVPRWPPLWVLSGKQATGTGRRRQLDPCRCLRGQAARRMLRNPAGILQLDAASIVFAPVGDRAGWGHAGE